MGETQRRGRVGEFGGIGRELDPTAAGEIGETVADPAPADRLGQPVCGFRNRAGAGTIAGGESQTGLAPLRVRDAWQHPELAPFFGERSPDVRIGAAFDERELGLDLAGRGCEVARAPSTPSLVAHPPAKACRDRVGVVVRVSVRVTIARARTRHVFGCRGHGVERQRTRAVAVGAQRAAPLDVHAAPTPCERRHEIALPERDLDLEVGELDLPRRFDSRTEEATEEVELDVRGFEVAPAGGALRTQLRSRPRVETGNVEHVDLVEIGVHLAPAAELPELLAHGRELLGTGVTAEPVARRELHSAECDEKCFFVACRAGKH